MEIHGINEINVSNGNYANYNNKKVNFTGKIIDPMKVIKESLPGGSSIEKMNKLSWLKGEIGGIILTALGTGLVAPIFIGFNPFVKAPDKATKEQKDDIKNTKLYTAMRQPISAVLAILFQAGVQKPIDKFLNVLINKGDNARHFSSHIDQTALNTESYIKSNIQSELKKNGEKKPSVLEYFKRGFKDVYAERKAYDAKVKEKASHVAKEQLDKLATSFQKTGEILINAERKDSRVLDSETIAELINQQVGDYVADAEALKVDVAEKLKRAEILTKHEDHLKEIFKDIPYEEEVCKTPLNETEKLEEYYKKTEEIIMDLLKKETDPEVKILLQEIADKPADLRTNKVRRTLDRIEMIKKSCGGEFNKALYEDKLKRRNETLDNIINDLKSYKFKDTANVAKEQIIDAIKNISEKCKFSESDELLKEILHDTDTFASDGDKLLSKTYHDIVVKYKELIGRKYKSFNQITKVIIGVFITLPITCNALNWVYPRFMEIFFPKLAGVKKNADAKKLQENKVDDNSVQKTEENKNKRVGLIALVTTMAALAVDAVATKGKFTNTTKLFSKVLGFLTNTKPMKSLANSFNGNLDKALALTTMGSIVVKDGIGCYKYVTQSMHNERIPEEKRKFVASLDLSNGILMIIAQIGMFALMNKFSTPLFNKIFKTSFNATNKSNTLNRIRLHQVKTGDEIARKLKLDKLFEKNKRDALSIFKFVLETAAATIVGKRVIVPLIATPLASKIEKHMNSIIPNESKEDENNQKADAPANGISTDSETNLLERYKKYYGLTYKMD